MPVDHNPPNPHLTRLTLGGGLAVLLAALATGIYKAALERNHDFNCFYDAAAAVRAGSDIYTAGDHGYIYPPLVAVIVAPLAWLDRQAASILWAVLTAALVPLVASLAATNAASRFGDKPTRTALWSIAALSVIVLAPALIQEFKDGNCNLIVLLAVVLAQRWLGKRPILCGLALGLAINIKYLPIVFIPYLLARGRWKELASTCVATVLFAAAPALVFGWDRNLHYLSTAYNGIAQLAGADAAGPAANIHELTWIESASIPSTLARIAEHHHLPHSAAWAGVLVLGVFALAAVWWLYRRAHIPLLLGRTATSDDTNPNSRAMVALEWPGLFIAALIFSPQTVMRHLNMALPFVAACAWIVVRTTDPRRWWLLGAMGLVCASMILRFGTRHPGDAPDPWKYFGGMPWCVLVMTFLSLWLAIGGLSVQTLHREE